MAAAVGTLARTIPDSFILHLIQIANLLQQTSAIVSSIILHYRYRSALRKHVGGEAADMKLELSANVALPDFSRAKPISNLPLFVLSYPRAPIIVAL